MAEKKLPTILMVEDEAADAALLRRGFEKVKVANPIVHLKDGDAAIAYLGGVGEYADRVKHPLPVLILLDLKMPGSNGLQVLQWLRGQREVRRIPVVVLTGDADPASVRAAYDVGANSYLVKPGDPADIMRMIDTIQKYWIGLNEAPQLVMRGDPLK